MGIPLAANEVLVVDETVSDTGGGNLAMMKGNGKEEDLQ
jgi:hypothetical protein